MRPEPKSKIYVVVRDDYDPEDGEDRFMTEIVGLYNDEEAANETAEEHAKEHLQGLTDDKDAEVKQEGGWVYRDDYRGAMMFEVRVECHGLHIGKKRATVAVVEAAHGPGNDTDSDEDAGIEDIRKLVRKQQRV